jgi:ribose 1,5-bisphosphokinase PhnN
VSNKNNLVVLIGASGVGKTTLQRSLAKYGCDDTVIIKRTTTRLLQDELEKEEVNSISKENFLIMKEASKFVISFERYGEFYGLEISELAQINARQIGVVSLPQKYIADLVENLSDQWLIYSCWLDADYQVVNERLEHRCDSSTEASKNSRIKSETVNHGQTADFYINAQHSKEDTLRQFLEVKNRILGTWSSLPLKSIAFLSKAIDILKAQQFKWCLFGGIAANWYIVDEARIATDIDILTDISNFSQFQRSFPEMKLLNHTLLRGEDLELRTRTIKLNVGSERYFWEFDNVAVSKLQKIRIENLFLPAMSAEDIIIMKCILQRGKDIGKADLEDVYRLLISYKKLLDQDYLIWRATKCKARNRVIECLNNLGLHVK